MMVTDLFSKQNAMELGARRRDTLLAAAAAHGSPLERPAIPGFQAKFKATERRLGLLLPLAKAYLQDAAL